MNSGQSSVAVITNVRSGRNRRRNLLQKLREHAVKERCLLFEASCPQEINLAIDQCRELAIPIIVIHGGDGTVQMVLTNLLVRSELCSYVPKLLLVPAGTTNMTHNDVGTGLPLITAVKEALRYIDKQSLCLRECSRYAMKITFKHEEKTICGMFFGAGAIYDGILYCRQNIHTRGVKGEYGPGLALLRFIWDWAGKRQLVTGIKASLPDWRGQESANSYSLIMFSTLQKLFLNICPFWGVGAGPLQVTLISQSVRMSFVSLIRLLRGRVPRLTGEGINSMNLDRMDLTVQGGFTVDGELFGGTDRETELLIEAVGPIEFLN